MEYVVTGMGDVEEEFDIKTEVLPIDAIPDKTKLVEIKDVGLISRIDCLIPNFVRCAGAVGNINNAIQASKQGAEVLYRVVIPEGEHLAKSRAMEGALRAFYHGPNGKIKGHANLVPVEVGPGKQGKKIALNAAEVLWQVAAEVVGQHYMTQINAELGKISNEITKIQNFQNNEYRSRVACLVANVMSILKFQSEILGNEEIRISKIYQLNDLEKECEQLLGQANLTLRDYVKKGETKYSEYEKDLYDVQEWFVYQKSLLNILYKIAELKYTLHFGKMSREQCNSMLSLYAEQVSDAQKRLAVWHENTVERLGIEINEVRRRREDTDKVLHLIPGLFKDDMNYCEIGESVVNMISEQRVAFMHSCKMDTSELYAREVQLISKDGKIYYLPEDR